MEETLQELIKYINELEISLKKKDEEIDFLKCELQKEYEATCDAKDIIIDLVNENCRLDRLLKGSI